MVDACLGFSLFWSVVLFGDAFFAVFLPILWFFCILPKKASGENYGTQLPGLGDVYAIKLFSWAHKRIRNHAEQELALIQ